VFIFVSVYLFIDSVRKLLYTLSYCNWKSLLHVVSWKLSVYSTRFKTMFQENPSLLLLLPPPPLLLLLLKVFFHILL